MYFQGEVWAESSMLGFLWHYYACMEGKIYDITEWVACKVSLIGFIMTSFCLNLNY